MKLSLIKSIIFSCSLLFVSWTYAQTNTVDRYIEKVGDHIGIYNGAIETTYNPKLYENFPYYKSSDFVKGEIVFRNVYYPNQRVRLDLFNEQLIALMPGKQYGIIINSNGVDTVKIEDDLFVWQSPADKNGLKQGYYLFLFGGNQLKLFCKEKFILDQKGIISRFEHQIKYYVLLNDQYYSVKNKGSLTKLFPQYKKQINKFAKDHKLNFNQDQSQSLVLLVNYCEELINSNSNQ
jgi:hypothetical protein